MTMHQSPPGSICLLRLSALGDVCNCVAAVRALQRRWPASRLTWIIGSTEHALVDDLPDVEFIVFDKKNTRASLASVRASLAGRRFDVLLLAQVALRANLLSLLVRARRRIGFDRARSREGHSLFVNERIPAEAGQHQALALHSFAEILGASVSVADRALPISEPARRFALSHQPRAHHAVLISPASSHPQRNWHAAGYAAVADWIVGQARRPVILIGGPSEEEKRLGEDISARMSQPVTNLIGKDTLKQALAMLERCACVVTPDAGPAHFAAALQRPVVGLYAATWSRRSGPLGSLDHCVDCFGAAAQQFLGKPPEQVRWGRRLERPGVMDLVTPDRVIARLAGILDTTPD